jgi:aspartyl-tRNA(Asn)/glutamyl-tRNA(Gln) amidotransferase subunit A
MELCGLSITDAADRLASREISSTELTRAVLERIVQVEPRLRAFVTVTEHVAQEAAAEADRRLAAGERGPLLGIPIALKDVLVTRGIRTTCSSKMLENYLPPFDATVWERLQAAGAVLVGKTNMDEFAMGSSTENSAFYPTHNPWDLDRVPGGSSGGSAVAVAAGEALGSLGTDTGGSIRQPAALTGVTGLKPTYGRVSRYGLIAFASSLDQVGPFAADVRGAARLLQAIAGHDPRDSTSTPVDVPNYEAALTGELAGVRLGVPNDYLVEGLDPGVRAAFGESVRVYESLGAKVIRDISLPSTPHALATYYIIAPSEASANLARYDGVKYGYAASDGANMWENMELTRQRGFGEEVKRRILIGTYALSAGYYDAYYVKASQVRTVIRREFEAAFERVDALITPTSPTVAFRIGEKTHDPYAMYLNDVLTIPVNMAGLPGISIPGGFSEGLPVGLQLIGRPFDEATLLLVADAYQRETDWHTRRAAL